LFLVSLLQSNILNVIQLEQPLRNTGVFKKGKASFESKVTQSKNKKRGSCNYFQRSLSYIPLVDDIYFSEAKFLSKQPKKAKKRAPTPSITSSSSKLSEGTAPKSIKVISKKSKARIMPQDADGSDDQSRSIKSGCITQEAPTQAPYNPADSIVWDIEKESCLLGSDNNDRQGTIVVGLPAKMQLKEKGAVVACDKTGSNSVVDSSGRKADEHGYSRDHKSDVSLAPSQSASRIADRVTNAGVPCRKPQSMSFASKYFAHAERRPSSPKDESHLSGIPVAVQRVAAEETPGPPIRNSTGTFLDLPISAPDIADIDNGNNMIYEPSSPSLYGHEYMVPQLGAPDCEAFLGSSCLWLPDDLVPVAQPYVFDPCFDGQEDYQDIFSSLETPTNGCDFYQEHLSRAENQVALLGVYPYNPDHEFLPFCSWDTISRSEEQFYDTGDEPSPPLCMLDPYVVPSEVQHDEAFNSSASCSDIDQRLPIDPYELLTEVSTLTDDAHIGESLLPNLSASSVDHFLQGRSLLYGLDVSTGSGLRTVSNAEAEVAGLLKQNHWLPHRL